MRKRSHIRDLFHHDTRRVDGADGGFTTLSGALHIDLNLTQTEVIGDLGTILGNHLGCVRSVLLGTSVSHLTSGRPGDHLTVVVGKRNDDIIKRGINERFS